MNRFFENFAHEFETPFTNSVLIFSVILFIILAVPVIFNRFKIPGIIGLILSGVIIGPNGLNFIKKNSAVDLFSTIGLLYIMFIAGLELDLAEFKKNKNKSILFGALTFAIPILIGLPVIFYFLQYGFATSLLTASMFATHTLIAYPIVSRLGISKAQSVAITVGGTILTDTAVLVLLAIISSQHEGGLSRGFWVSLLISILIFAAIVFIIVPRVSSWFFRRLEDEKYAHFIYVLSIVFFCAFVADLAGLEPIIGAFAAGLTLNRLIPHTSPLMNRIEFAGNSLFIPFFLISVGMLIDVKVLTEGYRPIFVAAVLTFVAIFSKWLAAQLSGLLLRYSMKERNLMFGLSTSHAAATLAIVLVGFQIGLIDDTILNATIILILATCVVASLVTDRAGKKMLLMTDVTPEPISRSQRILVPIANPDTMERLIDFALAVKSRSNPSPVLALRVVEDNDQAQRMLLESKKLLEKVIVHAASADQPIEITSTIDRNVTSGIKRVVTENFITDIILGWSAHKNLADIVFGKTFDNIVRQTRQIIFITRFVAPIAIQERMIVMFPVYAEKEDSFFQCLQNLVNVSNHLRMGIRAYSSKETEQVINSFIQLNQLTVNISFEEHAQYGNLNVIKDIVSVDDMIFFFCSRVGGISYNPIMDTIPRKAAQQFQSNNLIFVYPATAVETSPSKYEI